MAASSVLELTLHLDLNLRCDLDELFFGGLSASAHEGARRAPLKQSMPMHLFTLTGCMNST